MRKNITKRKREKEGLQEWMYEYQTTGVLPKECGNYNEFAKFGDGDDRFSSDTGRKYREEITTRFIKENPGKRPFCFWDQDEREPRRLVSGKVSPTARVWKYTFGVPSQQDSRERHGFHDERKEPYDPADPPVYETDLEYLKRLNLLTPEEKAQDIDIND